MELGLLGERVRPATLAAERVLPVADALAPLVPGGGLARGSVVAVGGPGATTLALAAVAEASRSGSWVAAVGVPHLGLVAAAGLGVDLERLVLVASPPAAQWGTVVAALAEAFDLVMVRPTHPVRPADARRLAGRLRERGGVLCHLRAPGGRWPEAPDLHLSVTTTAWRGLDPAAPGAGHLRSRRVVVEATGRRAAARPRRAGLWLPNRHGVVTLAEPVAPRAAHGPSRHLEAAG